MALLKELAAFAFTTYIEIWKVDVGEILACEQEPRNAIDRCAVAVKKDGTIIGHLHVPRKVSGPSLGCMYRKGAIWCHSKQPAALCFMYVWKCADHYYFSLTLLHVFVLSIFHVFYFCGSHKPGKYYYNKNFRNYSSVRNIPLAHTPVDRHTSISIGTHTSRSITTIIHTLTERLYGCPRQDLKMSEEHRDLEVAAYAIKVPPLGPQTLCCGSCRSRLNAC